MFRQIKIALNELLINIKFINTKTSSYNYTPKVDFFDSIPPSKLRKYSSGLEFSKLIPEHKAINTENIITIDSSYENGIIICPKKSAAKKQH